MDEKFISQRITQLRLQSNISEYRLSMELGKSVGYVQAISSGRSLPSVEQLYNMADYFGMTVSEFLDPGNQDPPVVRAAIRELRRLGEEDARLILDVIRRMAELTEEAGPPGEDMGAGADP